MREGIYIQNTSNGKCTGFVIYHTGHPLNSGLAVSPFTNCTISHVLRHASVRGLVDPMVYGVTAGVSISQARSNETEHLAGNGSWQSHLESVPGEE